MDQSIEHRPTWVTPKAVPIPIPAREALDDEATAERLHPAYGEPLRRVRGGPGEIRGLPFSPPDGDDGRRWLVLDRAVEVAVPDVVASHVVLLHFCDAWRDSRGGRPAGAPIGWIMPVGEPLARVSVRVADGAIVETDLRRRFEVNEGIIGWGSMAFLALPHLVEGPLDWRGPHARQGPGVSAAAGHAGPLAILPGSWGADQTGVQDHIPSATGDLTLWLHAIDIRGPDGQGRTVRSIGFEPIDGPGQGRSVVVRAITAFDGDDSPLRWRPRQALRVQGAGNLNIDVDLGIIARRAPLGGPTPDGEVLGWGTSGVVAGGSSGAEIIELTAAPDAALLIGEEAVALRELPKSGERLTRGFTRGGAAGGPVVEILPPAEVMLEVTIRSADGAITPARVKATALDGRILPPLGYRLEVNPAICEDSGAGLLLGDESYAYVEGSFKLPVPSEGASLEVIRGPETPPLRCTVAERDIARGSLELRLGPTLEPSSGRWARGDTHVHFLAPSTALLQSRAENVNAVHLLATQWGDHHTGVTDIGGDVVSLDRRHAVWVGSENRQNMLGHIGIVGTSSPVLPFASGGPPEGPIGGPVTHLMADWLSRCRKLGGLAIGAHFPLPMAEIAADIDAGLLDAIELQCFDHTLQSPPILEWYRYLDAGYRVPLVGGTDKMSATVPLGQVRTWARLSDDRPFDFDAWAEAIRAGRTFVTSGPILELRVEGAEPGAEISLTSGGELEVELTARAAQPVISDIEVVLDGAVVASAGSSRPTTSLSLREPIRVTRPGWIAARCRSPYAIGSAFASAMAAHTSALYVEVPGVIRPLADLRTALSIVDGTRAWVEHLAPVRDPAQGERFREFLDEVEAGLRKRAGGGSGATDG